MRNKQALSATINKEVFKEFDEYCVERTINRSLLVEKLIRKHLEEENEKRY